MLLSTLIMSVAAVDFRLDCVGKATQVVSNGDTLFFFAGSPELKTSDGSKVDWYLTSDTLNPVLTNSAENYNLSSGDGVAVKVGARWMVRYVFSYSEVEPSLTIETVHPNCRSTELTLAGTIPAIQYTTIGGQLRTLEHDFSVTFTSLAWGGEQWQDSLVVLDHQNLHVGVNPLAERMLKADAVSLVYDAAWRTALALTVDSLHSETVTPVAVASHPVSVTTIRGEKGERSNEVERPVEDGCLSGSAPLDILFKSNPTPAVEFYQWKIYRGTQLVVNRTDEDTRYTFMEPGSYRVVGWVSNAFCPCADAADPDCEVDSTEFTVLVSESFLRVPNAFSPNGDGKNDEFRVEYRSIREFNCQVFNRWGKLVYEWSDPAKGWDGTINGLPAPEGAYYYVIRAMGTDADKNAHYMSKIAYTKKDKNEAQQKAVLGVYQLSGDINLLRGKK